MHAETHGLRLQLLRAADRERWDAFVRRCPEATFFHLSGWQRVIEEAFGHRTWFYYVEQDGAIAGVLPLGEIRSRLFGHSLLALPFCVYGGVAADCAGARALLEQAAQNLAIELGVGHLEYRSMAPAHAGDPVYATRDLYYTFRKQIGPDNEANLLAIPRKQRAMVRKGEKLGLASEIDDGVRRMFQAYSASVHRLGTPVLPERYFALLKQEFGEQCEVRVIVQGRELVSAVLSFFFRNEVIPYYGGGPDIARQLAGNDYMYWSLMRDAAARGCTLFDFGRSKIGTGAFDFKKNWGFAAQPLGYEYRLVRARRMPDNQPLNPKYRAFIRLWQRLPLGLANAVGPLIARQLG
ncbi:MAG TPA: FemAB family XrtA/PEP-CTERM system-associated protein [Telluria sp.]